MSIKITLNDRTRDCYIATVSLKEVTLQFIDSDLNDVQSFIGTDKITYIKTTEGIAEYEYTDIRFKRNPVNAFNISFTTIDEPKTTIITNEDGTTAESIEYESRDVQLITASLIATDVKDDLAEVRSYIGMLDVIKLSLEEYKRYKIQLSKEQLNTYLENNPLVSPCHNGINGTYTITEAKQLMMTSYYDLYKDSKEIAPGISVLTWNETGGVCEVWQEDEFRLLRLQAGTVSKILVTEQQHYEDRVMKCTSKEEVDSIVLDYESVDDRSWIQLEDK